MSCTWAVTPDHTPSCSWLYVTPEGRRFSIRSPKPTLRTKSGVSEKGEDKRQTDDTRVGTHTSTCVSSPTPTVPGSTHLENPITSSVLGG